MGARTELSVTARWLGALRAKLKIPFFNNPKASMPAEISAKMEEAHVTIKNRSVLSVVLAASVLILAACGGDPLFAVDQCRFTTTSGYATDSGTLERISSSNLPVVLTEAPTNGIRGGEDADLRMTIRGHAGCGDLKVHSLSFVVDDRDEDMRWMEEVVTREMPSTLLVGNAIAYEHAPTETVPHRFGDGATLGYVFANEYAADFSNEDPGEIPTILVLDGEETELMFSFTGSGLALPGTTFNMWLGHMSWEDDQGNVSLFNVLDMPRNEEAFLINE